MKKLIITIAALLLTFTAFAQAPNKMSYQAVVRNANNDLVANSTVGMQVSILQGSVFGNAVYAETQTPMANENGLVSVEVGTGTAVFGNFADIDWSAGPYFIQTETDPMGGSNYSIIATSELMSVPFAMQSTHADSAVHAGNATFATTAGSALTSDDNAWLTSGNDISNKNNGKVGIGTSSPDATLDVDGTFRFTDGNEGAGKVLTSDANGQARWEEPGTKIAFSAYTTTTQAIPNASYNTINFPTETYDDGNGFNPNTGIFTAPSTGLYHFDLNITVDGGTAGTHCYVYLHVAGGLKVGNQTVIPTGRFIPFGISKDFKLNAGDQVKVVVWSYGANNVIHGAKSSFSGHKVY